MSTLKTPFRYDFVGSFLRPEKLKAAKKAFEEGTISRIEAADFFSVKYTYVDEAFVREAHSLGKEVHAWTVNYRGDIKRMLDVGVDNIITDNPVLVRKVKNQESDMQTDFWDLMRYAFKM